MLSVRDCDLEKLQKMTAVIKRVRDKMGIELPASGEAVQFTPTQSTVNAGKSHVDPVASEPVAVAV